MARRMTDEERAERYARRCAVAARDAIGCDYTIKRDGISYTGRIVECAVERFKRTGQSVVCLFRVVMECGTARNRMAFVVRRLPRS